VNAAGAINLTEDLCQLSLVSEASKLIERANHNGWEIAVNLIVNDVAWQYTSCKSAALVHASVNQAHGDRVKIDCHGICLA
jgi:hypothetical protein